MNDKHRRFCEEYCIDLNATQAAIRAGYSESTAYSIGSRLLKNVEVKKFIKELQSNLEKATGITKAKILGILKNIAESNIAKFYDGWTELKEFESIPESEKACIQQISSKVIKRNIGTAEKPQIINIEFVKLRLYDKQAAASQIANMLGYYKPQKIDLNIDKLSEYDAKLIVEQVLDKIINQSEDES